MDITTEYEIPFKGMKEGEHHFSFFINDAFLSLYEEEPDKGEINAEVTLSNKPNFLSFDIKLNGFVKVACDRCLDDTDINIDTKEKFIVKFGDENEESDIDFIYLHENEHKINLAPHIYEIIRVNIPVRNVHEERAECNQEALKRFEELEINNRNKSSDDRWDKLKDLLGNN